MARSSSDQFPIERKRLPTVHTLVENLFFLYMARCSKCVTASENKKPHKQCIHLISFTTVFTEITGSCLCLIHRVLNYI